jgi:alpha-galactosidase
VPRAAARLTAAERDGTRVRLRETRGAARRPTKSVADMARDKAAARANAAAADKGQMTRNAV